MLMIRLYGCCAWVYGDCGVGKLGVLRAAMVLWTEIAWVRLRYIFKFGTGLSIHALRAHSKFRLRSLKRIG